MDPRRYGFTPNHPSFLPSTRRRDARRGDAEPWPSYAQSEWLRMGGFGLLPPFVHYFPHPPPNLPPPAVACRHLDDADHPPASEPASLSHASSLMPRSPRMTTALDAADGSAKRDRRSRPNNGSGGSAESALRELHHRLGEARAWFGALYAKWKDDRSRVSYAQPDTLRELWQDLLRGDGRGRGSSGDPGDEEDENRLAGMAERIRRCMQQARAAVAEGSFLAAPADAYALARRRRVVAKVGLDCDGIIGLMRQAAADPAAGEVLLRELQEAIRAIDPKENADLYGDEREEGTQGQGQGQGYEGQGYGQQGGGSDNKAAEEKTGAEGGTQWDGY